MNTPLPAQKHCSKSAFPQTALRRITGSFGCALGFWLATPAMQAEDYFPNFFDIGITLGCHCPCACNTNSLATNNLVSTFLTTTPVVGVASSSAVMPPIGAVVPPHWTELLPSCTPPLYNGPGVIGYGPDGWTVTQSQFNASGSTLYEPVNFTLNQPLKFNLLDYWVYADLLVPDPFSTAGDLPVPPGSATQCQPYPWDVNLTLMLQNGQSYNLEQQLVVGYVPEVSLGLTETPVNYLETNGLLTVSLYCINGGMTNVMEVSGATLTAYLLTNNIPTPPDQTVGWNFEPYFFTNWDWPFTPGGTVDPVGPYPYGAAGSIQAQLSLNAGGVNIIDIEQTNLLVRANRAYRLTLSYMLNGYNIETLCITNTGVVPPCTNLNLVFYTDICSTNPASDLCYATNIGLVDIMGPPNDGGSAANLPGIVMHATGDQNPSFAEYLNGPALGSLPANFVLPVFMVNVTNATFGKWATENLGLNTAYEYFSSPFVYPLTEDCYGTIDLTNDFVMCPNDPDVVEGSISMCGPVDTNYYGGIGALSTLQFAVYPPAGNNAGLPFDPVVAPYPTYNAADPADPLMNSVSTLMATGGALALTGPGAPTNLNLGDGFALTEFDNPGAFTGPNAYEGNYVMKLSGLESLPSTWNVSDLHLVFGSPVNLDYHVFETGSAYTNVYVTCGAVQTNNIALCFGLVTIPVVNVYPQPIPANLIYTTLLLQVSGTGPGYTVGPITTNGFAFQYTSPTHNEADVQMFLPEGNYQYTATVVTAGGSRLTLGQTNYFTVACACATNVITTNTCRNGCITISNPNDIVVTSCTNVPVFYHPTATDACCTNVTLACYPPSGSVFVPGTTTTVTARATDGCGNSNTCTFNVTVQCGASTNTCTNGCLGISNPNDIVVTACTNVPVFYYPTATDACCTNVTLACYPPSGSVFVPGTTTTVTTLAADDCGNTNTCTFSVTVECGASTNTCTNGCLGISNPDDIVVNSCTNVPVFYHPTATDACCSNVTLACYPPSGSVFVPGTTTTVTTLAADACGNSNICSFTVSVICTNPCPTTNMISLNTGYNQNTNGAYATGSADAFWYVTGEPAGSGGTVPRPATAIAPNFYWLPALPDSQWISSYPTDVDTTNGEYDFETYFCLEPGATNLALNVCLRADDVATVSLNGHEFLQTPPIYSFLLPQMCGAAINPSWFLPGQQNVLHVSVTNLYGVAMGLNLTAVLTGSGMSVDNPGCCRPLSGISGQKFFDLSGTGVRNFMDPALAGWTIQLTGPNGTATTTTDGNGYYYFQNLAAGVYTVTEVPQAGWTQTAPAGGSCTVNLGVAEQVNGQDFGNYHTNDGCIQILCPSNLVVNCTGGGALATYTVAATNLCTNVVVKVYCTPPSGTFFPVGTTTVNCTAVDQLGDWATNCSFTVTVEDTNPPVFSGLTNLTVDCSTNWHFTTPTVTDDCGCSNFIVTALTPVTNGTCPQIITETWVATNLCNGLWASASQTVTNTCCTTNPCCAGCSAPYPISYTNTILPGQYEYLADNLCQGTNNSIDDVLTNLPSGTVLYLWDFTTQAFSDALIYLDAADAAPEPAGWYDNNFNPSNPTLSPGEGFVMENSDSAPLAVVIQGCDPGCPPPCEPPPGGKSLVGRLGLGTATWNDLFSCPPPCGAQMQLWNGSGYNTFTFANGAWTPYTPVVGAGQSAFVSVQPGFATTSISCPADLVVASCTNVQEFYAPTVTNACCGTNLAVFCTPPSGSYFAPGTTTTVSCVAIDCNGASNSCSFTITVQCSGAQVLPKMSSSLSNQILNINWSYLTNWQLQNSTDLIHWTYSGLTDRPPVFINLATTNTPPMEYYRLRFQSNSP